MEEFLSFRKFITPVIIQVLFWAGVVLVIIASLITMGVGITQSDPAGAFAGLMMLVLGPIGVRVYCELIIVFFRVFDVLTEIRDNTKPTGVTH